MKERPLLMSPYMVRAILQKIKSETRRLIEPQPLPGDLWQYSEGKSRYGLPGDQLWIKEAFATAPELNHLKPSYLASATTVINTIYYRADGEQKGLRWRASLFMPRAFSRINLLIKEIRAERLQDITEEGARAEGVQVWAQAELLQHSRKEEQWCKLTRRIAQQRREPIPVAASNVAAYAMLWDSLNPKTPWGSNPWVWVVKFKKI